MRIWVVNALVVYLTNAAGAAALHWPSAPTAVDGGRGIVACDAFITATPADSGSCDDRHVLLP